MKDFLVLVIGALVLTILIEILVAYIMKFRGKDQYKVITFMNLITNLSLNLLLSISLWFGDYGYVISLIVLEILVVYVEFRLLDYVFRNDYTKNKLMLLALLMNLASLSVGLVIRGIYN